MSAITITNTYLGILPAFVLESNDTNPVLNKEGRPIHQKKKM